MLRVGAATVIVVVPTGNVVVALAGPDATLGAKAVVDPPCDLSACVRWVERACAAPTMPTVRTKLSSTTRILDFFTSASPVTEPCPPKTAERVSGLGSR